MPTLRSVDPTPDGVRRREVVLLVNSSSRETRMLDKVASLASRVRGLVALTVAMACGISVMVGATPAAAYTEGAVTISLAPTGETYGSSALPVLREAEDYKLTVQYNISQLDPGDAVSIALGQGIGVPEGAIAVPTGNEAIDSMVVTDGVLTITFKDPLPNVNQGLVSIDFTAAEVSASAKTSLTWSVEGQPGSAEVYIKNTGDEFANVSTWRSKSASSSDLNSGVTVTDGTVSVASSIVGKSLPYRVTISSKAAVTGLTITDTIDSLLSIDLSSVTASLTTWDADGLNKTTSAHAVSPTSTSSGFSLTTEVPATSVLQLNYTASVKDEAARAALEAALQTAYDAVAETGGSWGYTFDNAVSYSDGVGSSTASRSIQKNLEVRRPDQAAAFAKSASPSTVGPAEVTDATDAGADLVSPHSVNYTLTADLTQFAGFEGTPFELEDNVVLVDTLPAQATWTIPADGLPISGWDDDLLMPATDLTGSIADAMAADEQVGRYYVDGQKLYVNLGRNTTGSYAVTAAATINDLFNTHPSTDWATKVVTYTVTNSVVFRYGTTTVSRQAPVAFLVPPDTTNGLDNPTVFDKIVQTAQGQAVTNLVVVPGTSATVPYTFVVGAGTVDLDTLVITDLVDTSVFDLSDLESIRAGVSGQYAWYLNMDASMFDVQLIDDTHLTIALSESGLETMESQSWPADGRLAVYLSLPTKVINGKQSLSISNSASLAGAKDQVTYLASQSVDLTSYGDELEVQKTVYDADTDSFTTNLRLDLDDEGQVVDDEIIYRIRVLPHGGYGTAGVSITPIVDILPQGVEFLGWVSSDDLASGQVTSENATWDLAGAANLRATVEQATDGGRDIVTLVNQPGKKLASNDPVSLYLKVRVVDFAEGVGITNSIGQVSATITATNDYPLDLVKLDSSSATTSITDRNARFQVQDEAGGVVVDNIYVVDGRLVVAGEDGNDEGVAVSEPGTYRIVEITAPAGYIRSAEATTVTVDEDGNSPQVKLFNEPGSEPLSFAVGDVVWIDGDDDGLQGGAEDVPLAGVTVTLLDGEGAPVPGVASQVTGADGLYLFDALPAGDYRVQFALTAEQAEEYVFTAVAAGADDGIDSDGVVSSDPAVAVTEVVTLDGENLALTKSYTAGEVLASEGVDPTWDAGVVRIEPEPEPEPASVTVGDLVWVDDGDGVQGGADDVPLADVVLTISGPDGEVSDVFGDVVGAEVTGTDGQYLFDDLPTLEEGQQYTVSIDQEASSQVLAPYLPTLEGQGDPSTDSSTWTASTVEALTTDGEEDLSLDFGFVAASNGDGGEDPQNPDSGEETSDDEIAFTGSDPAGLVAAGLLLAVAGSVLVAGRRRRR